MTERLPFHFSLSCIGEGNGNPLQCSCLENPRDRGAWWAAVYGVTQSRTRLKQLSSRCVCVCVCVCVRVRVCVCTYPWRSEWQPTPVFFPEEFHGQRSLVGYSPWDRKQLDMAEWLSIHIYIWLNHLAIHQKLTSQVNYASILKKRIFMINLKIENERSS